MAALPGKNFLESFFSRKTCRGSVDDLAVLHPNLARNRALGDMQHGRTLRKAFQLRDLDGLSISEAADILGVPHGTVKARLARARAKLKQLMGKAFHPKPIV